jgi:hypothetical protein
MMTEQVARVCDAIRANIDLNNLSLPDEYFYASLPLCVIDAVFSIGVTYTSTAATVARWCERQTPAWQRIGREGGGEHTISYLIAALEAVTSDHAAATLFGNRQRTSSQSGLLKAEAVMRWARVLAQHGVETFGDTDDVDRNAAIERDIRLIPGQGSGISWEYFLMLAGSDDFVKADRMICRFIASALELDSVPPATARTLLLGASDLVGVKPRPLDYAIWQLQRGLS